MTNSLIHHYSRAWSCGLGTESLPLASATPLWPDVTCPLCLAEKPAEHVERTQSDAALLAELDGVLERAEAALGRWQAVRADALSLSLWLQSATAVPQVTPERAVELKEAQDADFARAVREHAYANTLPFSVARRDVLAALQREALRIEASRRAGLYAPGPY